MHVKVQMCSLNLVAFIYNFAEVQIGGSDSMTFEDKILTPSLIPLTVFLSFKRP